jgi:hypothetical protein
LKISIIQIPEHITASIDLSPDLIGMKDSAASHDRVVALCTGYTIRGEEDYEDKGLFHHGRY